MSAANLNPALDGNKLAFQWSTIAYRKIQGYLFLIHFEFYHLEYGALFFKSYKYSGCPGKNGSGKCRRVQTVRMCCTGLLHKSLA